MTRSRSVWRAVVARPAVPSRRGWTALGGVCLAGLCLGCDPEPSPETRVPPAAVEATPSAPAAATSSEPAATATASGTEVPAATAAAINTSAFAATASAATTVPAAPPASTSPAPGGLRDITFEHLKFNIEKGQTFERKMLTPEVERLEGTRIRIRGFILPQSMLQSTGAKEFVFVRDNGECCFGPGAALYDCMRVEMAPDKTADFNVLPIALEGTLIFDPLEFGGQTLALFFLKDTVVR